MALITTLSFENTSAGSVASNFIAPMFGHPFKKGDMPAGSFPRFELSDGTVCAHTMYGTSTWDDGSLKLAGFLLRVPSSVSALSTMTVNLTNNGTTAHGTSNRSLSECSSAGTDINVEVVGLDHLSGTWVSKLNQGIADGAVEILGNGPAGLIAKVTQEFMQSNSNHGQLETWFYVVLLQDASGNLAGIRYLGRVVQPYYNVDTPTKSWRSFSSFILKNGTNIVRNCWAAREGVATPIKYPTTLTSIPVNVDGQPYRSRWFEVSNLGMENQTLVRLSGTTLPTGMSASTSYFVDGTIHPNHVGLYNECGLDSSDLTTPSGSASNDLTITAYPYLTHFGSLYTAGNSARYDYVQAGGSIAVDAPVRVRHNSEYWQSTGLVGPYGASSVDPQAEYGYELNSMTPITRYVGRTGEREDLGVLPGWSVKHLISQRAIDEKVVRATGLKHAHAAIAVYDSVTKSIRPLNNQNYAGMPTTSTDMRWSGNSLHTSGFTHPSNRNTKTGLSGLGFDHMPTLSSYPYLLTGEPQFLDTLTEMANLTVMTGYTPASTLTAKNGECERNAIINGTAYYGVVAFNAQARVGAWALREIGYAAALTPDNHKYKQYFVDLNANNYAAMRAYNDNVATPFWRSSGLLAYPSVAVTSPWMTNYMGQAIAQASRMTQSANALYMLNHLVKWNNSVFTNHGGWCLGSFHMIVMNATEGGDYVTSMDQVGYGPIGGVSWSSVTNRITIPATQGYTAQNGDAILWARNSNGSGFGDTAAPQGFTACTSYYLINKSGNTYEVSATPGGAPLTFPESWSSTTYIRPQATPSTGDIDGNASPGGYISNARGMLKLAKMAGATVNQAMLDDLDGRLSSTNYADDPRYFFSDSGAVVVPPPDPEPDPQTRQVKIKLVTEVGDVIPSLANLKWALFSGTTPSAFGAPIHKGSSATTNVSGDLTIPLTGTTLTAGQTVWLLVTDSDGNPITQHKAFSGPVIVE